MRTLNVATEVEIVIGMDRVVRINVDGLCEYRVRAEKIVVRNDLDRKEDEASTTT